MAKINSRAADQQRHERWRELLARWQSSGLSQAAFCRRERIHVWQFAWWKKRGATCSDVATMCAERLRFRCSGSGCDCQATCLSVTMGRCLRPWGWRECSGYSHLGGGDRTVYFFGGHAFRPMKSGQNDVT
jgi:hypothetical protein